MNMRCYLFIIIFLKSNKSNLQNNIHQWLVGGAELLTQPPKMASLHHLLSQPIPNLPSSSTPLFPQYPIHIPSLTSLKPKPSNPKKSLLSKSLTVPLALTGSSDSPTSLEPNDPQSLLQQLAVIYVVFSFSFPFSIWRHSFVFV